MNKRHKIRRKILVTSAILSSVGLVGTVTGTVAWYQYATNASVTFTGTTVGGGESLDVGFKSPTQIEYSIEEQVRYGFTEFKISDDCYYYMFGGSIDSDAMSFIMGKLGLNATSSIRPVTTGIWNNDGNDNFTLYNCPEEGINNAYWDGSRYSMRAGMKSNVSSYVALPLVFRAFSVEGGVDRPVEGAKIILSSVGAQAQLHNDNQTDCTEGLRLLAADNVLYRLKGDAGYINVAGELDLDDNGYYDVTTYDDCTFLYGQIEGGLVTYETEGVIEEEAPEVKTTFDAVHKVGTRLFTQETRDRFGKQCFSDTDSLINSYLEGDFNKTGENGFVELPMTLFLEGWDRCTVDSVIGTDYNLMLQFQMTK